MVTIKYSYVTSDGVEHRGEWSGARDEALRAGVEGLDASVHPDGRWTYWDDATQSYWAVGSDDVVRLGAALLGGRSLVESYSVWCAGTFAEELQ